MADSALDSATVTIANGASLSGAATVTRGYTLVGILMPAAWTAASLTFQASFDGTTFGNVYDSSGELANSNASTDRFLSVSPTLFLGANQVKVRSGTSAAAVNQGAARDIRLIFREV